MHKHFSSKGPLTSLNSSTSYFTLGDKSFLYGAKWWRDWILGPLWQCNSPNWGYGEQLIRLWIWLVELFFKLKLTIHIFSKLMTSIKPGNSCQSSQICCTWNESKYAYQTPLFLLPIRINNSERYLFYSPRNTFFHLLALQYFNCVKRIGVSLQHIWQRTFYP